MTSDLRDTLLKIGLALFAIVIPLVVAKLRGFDVRDFAGLNKPRRRPFVLLIAVWIAWMVLTELLLNWLQIDQSGSWRPYEPIVLALRILTIGILGPIAEELVFRGVVYGRLVPRLGPAVTIILTAVLFGIIHSRYDWSTIAFVCIDGLLFGYARYKTGSTYTAMTMHAMGNLVSIMQSLT
jgi:membrane protease YdiL (CAAX protease family)